MARYANVALPVALRETELTGPRPRPGDGAGLRHGAVAADARSLPRAVPQPHRGPPRPAGPGRAAARRLPAVERCLRARRGRRDGRRGAVGVAPSEGLRQRGAPRAVGRGTAVAVPGGRRRAVGRRSARRCPTGSWSCSSRISVPPTRSPSSSAVNEPGAVTLRVNPCAGHGRRGRAELRATGASVDTRRARARRARGHRRRRPRRAARGARRAGDPAGPGEPGRRRDRRRATGRARARGRRGAGRQGRPRSRRRMGDTGWSSRSISIPAATRMIAHRGGPARVCDAVDADRGRRARAAVRRAARSTGCCSTRRARASASCAAGPRRAGGCSRRRSRELAALQRGLLAAAAAAVRPGGRLVYSVCTLTAAETIGVDEWAATQLPDFVAEPPPGAPWRRSGGALAAPAARPAPTACTAWSCGPPDRVERWPRRAEGKIAPSILAADFAELADEVDGSARGRPAARRRDGRPLRAEPLDRAAGGEEPAARAPTSTSTAT